MNFACRRHNILITPHKRNEVERSVGYGDHPRKKRVKNTLLLASRVVACLWHADFRRAFHPTLRPIGLSMGLLELHAFSMPCSARFQIEKLKYQYIYICKSIYYIEIQNICISSMQ